MIFSINRSLCEIDFNKELKNIDVDILEYVWFKIRESFLQNDLSTSITVKFTELTKNIGKYQYQNQSLADSIQRLDDLTLTTNIKQNLNMKRLNFKFESYMVNDKPKGFTVSFNEKMYRLFDKPTSYNEYNQNNIYNLNTYYSKLFYKFAIGYKLLKQKSFFVENDILLKILNIKNEESISYIKSNFIDKSIKEISTKTDLKISIKKECEKIKNKKEIVKYKVTIDKFEGSDMDINLKQRTRNNNNKTDAEIRIDGWIKDCKNKFKADKTSKQIPFVGIVIENNIPILIDDDYKLTDGTTYYSDSPTETMNTLNDLAFDERDIKIDVVYLNRFDKNYSKVCFLSKDELRRRGFI